MISPTIGERKNEIYGQLIYPLEIKASAESPRLCLVAWVSSEGVNDLGMYRVRCQGGPVRWKSISGEKDPGEIKKRENMG